jgi:peptide chain release factor 1
MYEDIINNFKNLETQLSDQSVLTDPKKLREISKKHTDLKYTVGLILELKKKQTELEQSEDMIKNESDQELLKITKDEITELKQQIEKLTNEIESELNPADPNDKKNIIMEIRAGTGGDESALFAAELFRLYAHYAEKQDMLATSALVVLKKSSFPLKVKIFTAT